MSEKLIFLKREEIRTMAKDLAKLQEEEALKEKEKISRLKLEEKLAKETSQREEIIKTMIPGENPIPEPEGKNSEEEISSRIGKISPWKKILVRTAIVLSFFAFLFLIGFTYWYLVIRKKPTPQPSPSPSASVPLSPSPESPTPSPTESISPEIPPIPIIAVKEIKIVDLGQEENTQEQLRQAINDIILTSSDPEFYEILPKKNDQFWGLKSLAGELGLGLPENFFTPISDEIKDFDFYIYGKNNLKQGFGLVIKTKDKDSALSLLNSWEPTMPSDLNNLFVILNKQTTLVTTSFKQAAYAGTAFRYLSFKESNLGICWSVYQDYLIITSSGEIMTKTMDLIRTK
ncbi:hypothetical protein L6250_03330 [Candidatus Parcubacteria bacterium]|nr:hypothetical protein [Patescibacteria group bacterium]MBU4466573.1 hypothetical protein [Patescibacteria group bacterium]MCG2688637.1 hypothetical protein [Candidatus Parcubacteria bacterium]